MRAWVYEKYGPPEVLELRDVPTPAPGRGEILVKSRATAVTAGDWRVRSLDVPAGFGLMSRLLFGVFKPRKPILGMVLAGEVVALGDGVSRFAVGDPVIVFDDSDMGCHAEYKAISESKPVVKKPEDLSWEEAAAIPFGATTALHFLRKGEVQSGDHVLVNGASGEVGVATVQLAKLHGAEVTGVCSAANVELVESLGADRVIDYTREDFTESGQTYDVIVDTAGTARYSRVKSSLSERGRLLVINGDLPAMLRAPWVGLTSKKRVVTGVALASLEDLRRLVERVQAGELKPVVGQRFAFDEMVEAHRLVDSGRKRGCAVVTFEDDAGS